MSVAAPTASERAANGQFTPGNDGGPGNLYARLTAELRKLLLTIALRQILQKYNNRRYLIDKVKHDGIMRVIRFGDRSCE